MLQRVLTLVLVCIAGVSDARAQIQITTQDRRVELSADAPPVSNVWTLAAPDQAPFNVNHSISPSSSEGTASAGAVFQSTLLPDRITGAGNPTASANFTGPAPTVACTSSSATFIDIAFVLAQPATYTLSGSLSWLNANPFVTLSGPGGIVFYETGSSSFGSSNLQRSGVLAAGNYTLTARASAGMSDHLWWNFYHSSTFDFVLEFDTIVVTPFCAGDGSATACPCGNLSPAGAQVGCLSSTGSGGKLRGVGGPRLSSDTFALVGSQMTDGAALYFQGTSQQSGGNGTVFADGLYCAGGTLTRLATRMNSSGASQFPSAGDPPISVVGTIASAGTRTYQVWFRDSPTFCTPAGSNTTNGLEVQWEQ